MLMKCAAVLAVAGALPSMTLAAQDASILALKPRLVWESTSRPVGSLLLTDKLYLTSSAPRNSIHVLDPQFRELSSAVPSGLKSIGDIGVIGSVAWVSDRQGNEIHRLQLPSLKSMSPIAVPTALRSSARAGPPTSWVLRLLPDGSAVGWIPSRPGTTESGALVRAHGRSRAADTLRIIEAPDNISGTPSLLRLRTLWDVSANGGLIGLVRPSEKLGAVEVVVVRVATGEEVFSRTLELPAVHLSPAAADSIYSRSNEGTSGISPRRPAVLPPVDRLHVGNDGRVWIRLNLYSANDREWRMLLPDGTLAGVLRLPAEERIRIADGQTLWTFAQKSAFSGVFRRYVIDVQ